MSVFRLEKIADARFPTRFGTFRIFGFVGHFGDRIEEAVVLVMGELTGQPPLVRIHSQCLTGDVFHSLRCDCRDQLEMALDRIAADGRGILLYEHQEGRGIGIMNKLRAYALQDQGADTIEANEQLGFAADLRNYELPVAILQYFGLKSVRFMSNNPEKIAALEAGGIEVAERVPMVAEPVAQRDFYLKTKRDRMGHLLAEALSEPPIA